MSTVPSSTRIRISFAGLYDLGTPVQPVAGVGAAPGNGSRPAYPAGWSNCRPNEAMNAASSKSSSPFWPMKFVVTPRPEEKVWKSIVGPWIEALRPPAHSIWATFRPPRSAACAIDSACSTPGSNAAVRLVPNGSPFLWNVLLVEPVTPGHAPVAIVYQPAPVLGGAWVSMPSPRALTPFLRNFRIVGITPWSAYFSTRSWRMPSEAKKTALPEVEGGDGWCPPPLWADAAGVPTARAATAAGATRARAAATTTGRRALRFSGSPSTMETASSRPRTWRSSSTRSS